MDLNYYPMNKLPLFFKLLLANKLDPGENDTFCVRRQGQPASAHTSDHFPIIIIILPSNRLHPPQKQLSVITPFFSSSPAQQIAHILEKENSGEKQIWWFDLNLKRLKFAWRINFISKQN